MPQQVARGQVGRLVPKAWVRIAASGLWMLAGTAVTRVGFRNAHGPSQTRAIGSAALSEITARSGQLGFVKRKGHTEARGKQCPATPFIAIDVPPLAPALNPAQN